MRSEYGSIRYGLEEFRSDGNDIQGIRIQNHRPMPRSKQCLQSRLCLRMPPESTTASHCRVFVQIRGQCRKVRPGIAVHHRRGGGYVDCHPLGLRKMYRHQAAAGTQGAHSGQYRSSGHTARAAHQQRMPEIPLVGILPPRLLLICDIFIFINFYLFFI